MGLRRVMDLARKSTFNRWYEELSNKSQHHLEWTFMNYGYASKLAKPPKLKKADQFDQYAIWMYHRLFEWAGVEGRDVLDAGSGRGGGASYCARYLKPQTVTGLDYSANQVEWCNNVHSKVRNLSFVHGDAERMPFEEDSFDVVISVEASHCFSSMRRFLGQVHRVLRPDGDFVLTDFRDKNEIDELRRDFDTSGFRIVEESNITAEVIAALDIEHERKQAFIDNVLEPQMREQFAMFAATRGTMMYEAFKSRSSLYLSFHLVRVS